MNRKDLKVHKMVAQRRKNNKEKPSDADLLTMILREEGLCQGHATIRYAVDDGVDVDDIEKLLTDTTVLEYLHNWWYNQCRRSEAKQKEKEEKYADVEDDIRMIEQTIILKETKSDPIESLTNKVFVRV